MLVDRPYCVVSLSAAQLISSTVALSLFTSFYQHIEIKWQNFIYVFVPRTVLNDTVISSDQMALIIWATKNN
jgi:hypothetical protein